MSQGARILSGRRLHPDPSAQGDIPKCPADERRDRPEACRAAENNVRHLGKRQEVTVGRSLPVNPDDWFPNDHRVPNRRDAKESVGARACGICHLPNGKGLMQNGGVAGLQADYIVQQLVDFKSGNRHSADLNKANAFEMQAIARNLTDAEMEAAAAYFSSLKFTKWIRVVESTTVPKLPRRSMALF